MQYFLAPGMDFIWLTIEIPFWSIIFQPSPHKTKHFVSQDAGIYWRNNSYLKVHMTWILLRVTDKVCIRTSRLTAQRQPWKHIKFDRTMGVDIYWCNNQFLSKSALDLVFRCLQLPWNIFSMHNPGIKYYVGYVVYVDCQLVLVLLFIRAGSNKTWSSHVKTL